MKKRLDPYTLREIASRMERAAQRYYDQRDASPVTRHADAGGWLWLDGRAEGLTKFGAHLLRLAKK